MQIIIKKLQKRIPVNPTRIRKLLRKALSLEKVNKPGEITVTFVSDKTIKKLNSKYLNKDATTDVIAFDNSLAQNKKLLADIIISTDAAIRNSAFFNTTPEDEIYLYVAHGILHLMGYNDGAKKDRLIMRKKERALLEA